MSISKIKTVKYIDSWRDGGSIVVCYQPESGVEHKLVVRYAGQDVLRNKIFYPPIVEIRIDSRPIITNMLTWQEALDLLSPVVFDDPTYCRFEALLDLCRKMTGK